MTPRDRKVVVIRDMCTRKARQEHGQIGIERSEEKYVSRMRS